MLVTFLVIVKQVLLLGVDHSFSRLKKWVRQILCPIIVHSSNKRITIKHKINFLNPNQLFTPIAASGFSSLVCSGCATLSQPWRTSVSPTAWYSQICAEQVISCGLPWVATICIFKMLKSNFSFFECRYCIWLQTTAVLNKLFSHVRSRQSCWPYARGCMETTLFFKGVKWPWEEIALNFISSKPVTATGLLLSSPMHFRKWHILELPPQWTAWYEVA